MTWSSKSPLLKFAHHGLTWVLPVFALVGGCNDTPTNLSLNSDVRCSLSTRVAVRCQDGAALLFFEPHLEAANIPAGERMRIYLGETLLKDTLADAGGFLSFTTSISSDPIPELSLVLGKDSLVWDPADSMAVDDTTAAPIWVGVWAEKDTGQKIVSMVTFYSLLATNVGRRIACGSGPGGAEIWLDEYKSYNATGFWVDAEVMAAGNKYSFSAATGETMAADSIFAEQKFQFPVLQARSAPMQRKRIKFKGPLPHLPGTLQMSLGADFWRFHIIQE